MPTSRRAHNPRVRRLFGWAAVLISALGTASLAGEPAPVVEGLTDPSGVAVRVGPRGGVEVVVAEAAPPQQTIGRVVSYVLLGELVQSTTTLVEAPKADAAAAEGVTTEGQPALPVCLGWAEGNTLIAASHGVRLYELRRRTGSQLVAAPLAAAKAPAGVAGLTSIVAGPRYLYGVGEGALWRSRMVGDALTDLRQIPSDGAPFVAVAKNPEGYLVVLRSTERSEDVAGSATLQFLDPSAPEKGGPTTPVEGLSEPIALAYGATPQPSEPRLYALTRDGVYRLDATNRPDAPPGCTATRVVEIAEPRAFAFGPDGAVYLVASPEGETGTLFRATLE